MRYRRQSSLRRPPGYEPGSWKSTGVSAGSAEVIVRLECGIAFAEAGGCQGARKHNGFVGDGGEGLGGEGHGVGTMGNDDARVGCVGDVVKDSASVFVGEVDAVFA